MLAIHLRRILCACAVLSCAAIAARAEEARAVFPWLQWHAEQIAFALREAEEGPASGNNKDVTLEDLAEDIAILRLEVKRLIDSMEYNMTSLVGALRAENEALREEMRRIYERYAEGYPIDPPVPRPGGALLDEVLAERPARPAPAPPAKVPFGLNVVSEWGRTPAEARELGEKVPSLRGMVGVVPPGSSEEDLEKLARDLRGSALAYDNINIEIFDDPAAAQSFAERNVGDPAHRVLSISKHKATGRDVILLFRDGVAEELPP